jgi:ABC-2 type transport system ATP-binding protein
VLLTTQYLDEADQLADRVSVIDRGRKVAEGTPDELKTSVGASTLQLRLEDPDQLSPAAQILERVLRQEPVPTPEAGGLNVALDAADQAADALIALRQGHVSIASVSVAKPSLDEVFLALTGHDTTVPDTNDDELEPAR